MSQAKTPITAHHAPPLPSPPISHRSHPTLPSPSIPAHPHFIPSLTDDSSFFRPPREADIRACQPREVYVYRVKRGGRRHSRPHTPLIRTSFLEDMSRFSPAGTVHHSQRLEVPRTFYIGCGVIPYSAGLWARQCSTHLHKLGPLVPPARRELA